MYTYNDTRQRVVWVVGGGGGGGGGGQGGLCCEKYMPRVQKQLHMQLGYKNGLDGKSHIHSGYKSPQNATTTTWTTRVSRWDGIEMGATPAFIAKTFGCSRVAVTSLMNATGRQGILVYLTFAKSLPNSDVINDVCLKS